MKWIKYQNEAWYEVFSSIYDKKPVISQIPFTSTDYHYLPPCEGNKVIALAYNYKSLVGKDTNFDEPLFFFKSSTGLIGHHDQVLYPDFGNNVWLEAELSIVIGAKGKNISMEEVDDYILGYTCGNDITCENIHNRDWHLARSKGLDTFCPLGPYLVKGIDTDSLIIRSFINGKMVQNSNTSDRIFNDKQSVCLISKYITLMPGDVILTGTPAGATDAIIRRGDQIKIEIENIGTLINTVK
ncbi:MAG: fumarylacetoacetate hydrolase family protein [bacterium]|nr:fumarylacetoacetate hydrolase family protein [bacterium]